MVGDACYRPLITIRSHNSHVGNIRGVVGEIVFARGTSSFPCLVLVDCASFGLALAFPFVLCGMVVAINFYWVFFVLQKIDIFMLIIVNVHLMACI